MASDPVPILLVTANVGSIFEDPSVMLKMWTKEFLETMIRLKPKFVALHCQEVGGKNYEESMQHVEYFVKLLMESDDLKMFDKVRIYLDEDYSSAENFTALGNFYFIHESISDVLMWDFEELCFIAVEGKEVFAGNIEDVSTKEKSKFPQDFFPECKWSRKGFQRTRWNLNGTVFDLINIHLFHDASNFVAMETCMFLSFLQSIPKQGKELWSTHLIGFITISTVLHHSSCLEISTSGQIPKVLLRNYLKG